MHASVVWERKGVKLLAVIMVTHHQYVWTRWMLSTSVTCNILQHNSIASVVLQNTQSTKSAQRQLCLSRWPLYSMRPPIFPRPCQLNTQSIAKTCYNNPQQSPWAISQIHYIPLYTNFTCCKAARGTCWSSSKRIGCHISTQYGFPTVRLLQYKGLDAQSQVSACMPHVLKH